MFAAAGLSGLPCAQEGGGVVGACAEGAGAGLVSGCDPGPAPGWAEDGTGGWAGGDGLTAGCCAQAGGAAATIPAATAANNRLRGRDRTACMAIPPGLVFKIATPGRADGHLRVSSPFDRTAIRQFTKTPAGDYLGFTDRPLKLAEKPLCRRAVTVIASEPRSPTRRRITSRALVLLHQSGQHQFGFDAAPLEVDGGRQLDRAVARLVRCA